MNLSKSLILLQVISPASALVIHLTDHPAGQYPKGLEQSQEEKAVKITKAVKTVIKARKLKNIAKAAYLSTSLLSLHYPPCLSKKPHLDDKNLQQNLFFSFFPSFKPKYQYYFYPP